MKWSIANPSSIDLYRDRTNAASSSPIILRRKRCTCGRVVTAKQLVQHGACVTCARTAANNIQEAA